MKKHEPKKTAKKGLFRIVFSRSGIMLLLILMQIGVFTITTSRLQAYSTAISGIMLCMPSYSNHLRNQFGGQSGI